MSEYQHGKKSDKSAGLRDRKLADAKQSIERRAARKAAQQKAAQRRADEARQTEEEEKLGLNGETSAEGEVLSTLPVVSKARETARERTILKSDISRNANAKKTAVSLNPTMPSKKTANSEAMEMLDLDSDEARLRRIRMQQTQVIPNVDDIMSGVENLDNSDEKAVESTQTDNTSEEEAERAAKLRRIRMQQTRTIPNVSAMMEDVEDLDEEEPLDDDEDASWNKAQKPETEKSDEETIAGVTVMDLDDEQDESDESEESDESDEADETDEVDEPEENDEPEIVTAAPIVLNPVGTESESVPESQEKTESKKTSSEKTSSEKTSSEKTSSEKTSAEKKQSAHDDSAATDKAHEEIHPISSDESSDNTTIIGDMEVLDFEGEGSAEDAKELTPEEAEAKKKKRKKIRRILGGVLGAALIAVYVGLSMFYFRDHFYPRTSIGDLDVSYQTEEDVHSEYSSIVAAYQLELDAKDGTSQNIKGSEIALKLDWTDYVPDLLHSQNGFEWPIKFFQPTTYEANRQVTYDTEKLKTVVESLDCMSAEMQVMPVDAHLSDWNEEKGFSVVDATEGTAVDEEILLSGIEQAITDEAQTASIQDMGAYYEPNEVDLDALQKRADALSDYCKAVITYKIGTTDEFVLDPTTYQAWLVIADDGSISVDKSQVEAYVETLEAKYNTYDKAKTLKTASGSYVTITNVHYGWEINHDKEVAAIIYEIENGVVHSRDLYYSQKAASHGTNDYGDSYVAISISQQHLWLYKNGELILESNVVTGCVSKGTETPKGIWKIRGYARNAVLKGEDYETPVSYWMPFNGGIGLHDADWRGSFGGTIYLKSGSHGCVNLPPAKAKEIFENVYIGYPVIVY